MAGHVIMCCSGIGKLIAMSCLPLLMGFAMHLAQFINFPLGCAKLGTLGIPLLFHGSIVFVFALVASPVQSALQVHLQPRCCMFGGAAGTCP